MEQTWSIDLMWWITAVELPAMAGLFWMNWRLRRDLETLVSDSQHEAETGISWLRDGLAAYKLEVAKSYASISYIKDVERRLTDHLVRIETKLDAVAQHSDGRKA